MEADIESERANPIVPTFSNKIYFINSERIIKCNLTYVETMINIVA